MGRKKKLIEADVTETPTSGRVVRPTQVGVMATWDIGDRKGRVALLRDRLYSVVESVQDTYIVRCPVSGHLFSVDSTLVEDV